MRRAAAVVAGAVALLAPAPPAGSSTTVARATVNVTDNAFSRGGRERPVVDLRPGGTVTWRWRGQESHQVTGGSAARRFVSRTQSRGSFARRFPRRGTYRVVCSIHAPGMRMTVRVG